jgi:curli biogenesis system outer membrane secretion channel CsgG
VAPATDGWLGWIGRLGVGCLLWLMAGGAGAQGWGLQLRDAPGGQAAEVVAVAPGSPAAAAGLRPGDWVTQAQNFLVRNAQDYANIVRLSEGRGTLLLRVARDGWERELQLAAAAVAPGVTPAPAPVPMPTAPPKAWLGLEVADAPRGNAQDAVSGATVAAVAAGGPAASAGLRPGDLIVQIEGRPIAGAEQLAALVQDWPVGRALRLSVQREGWTRDLSLTPGVLSSPGSPLPPGTVPLPGSAPLPPAATGPSPYPVLPFAAPPRGADPVAPSAPAAPRQSPAAGGNKALVSIGEFQVKAATAGQAIGEGLREMLVTALFSSGSYAVIERQDLPGLAAEQALVRSRMAREGQAVTEPQQQMAEIMVHGAVTEFDGDARGGSGQFSLPGVPLNIGRSGKTAHMAIDVRVVDVNSGRILGAQRIVGSAQSSNMGLSGMAGSVPMSLGVYRNTPMEAAIRTCVEQAVAYISATVPPRYFSHN